MKSHGYFLPLYLTAALVAFEAYAQPGQGPPPQGQGFGPPGGQQQGFRGPRGGQQGFRGPGGQQQGLRGPGGQQGFRGSRGGQQGFQGPGGQQQGFGGPGGRQGFRAGGLRMGGGSGFGPPPNPLFEAIDGDKNGELSSAEIENAVAALRALDKDGNGKLTHDEVRPEPPPVPENAAPGQGTFQPRNPAADGSGLVARIMSHDADGDGSVTESELPRQMRRMLERADSNEDGALDRAEVEEMASNRGRRGGRGGEAKKEPEEDSESPTE